MITMFHAVACKLAPGGGFLSTSATRRPARGHTRTRSRKNVRQVLVQAHGTSPQASGTSPQAHGTSPQAHGTGSDKRTGQAHRRVGQAPVLSQNLAHSIIRAVATKNNHWDKWDKFFY